MCENVNIVQFLKGSSPPLETDEPLVEEPDVPTEIDSDGYNSVGQKRRASIGRTDPR